MKTLARLSWIALTAVVLAALSFWLYRYTEDQRRIAQLEREKEQLRQIVNRLTSQRRMAEIIVTGREGSGKDQKVHLLMVEYARDGQTPAVVREFVTSGSEVHIDAKVIQFERDFLFENDPLRGASIALFTRIYGDQTAPDKGEPIDPVQDAPLVYKGADPGAAEFEARLWCDFWRLLEDQAYAKQHGVRVAYGDGKWWPPKEGTLYTLSIATSGDLEVKAEPVKAIYLEAMKKLSPSPRP
jgi:hypothetical protein